MLTIQIGLFLILTGVILWVSLPALKQPRSHGFTRTFAWEAIAILITLNLEYWFIDPTRWHQIIAWTLLSLSLVMILPAVRLFRTRGKPDPGREGDPSLVGIEKTTRLVTTGLYRYIRHPFYSSLLFLAWGAAFKHLTLITIGLALISTVFLIITARREEHENLQFFGEAYQHYRAITKMFIPFIY
ncbi:MAG: isoprenylcysteine carboxylmethyltransferase family protein [Anaerolineales bacterium]|nr:isoprenylcysteine carboxylmethyltransferase family protein [Anaerolineales bacterium]